MYYGTEMPPFGDIWREMQKKWDGDIPSRNADDDVERRFWRQYVKEQGYGGPDTYSADVWKVVEGILGDAYYNSILEVGPGWGNYSFRLAERCRELTCVDISPDVLRYISQAGQEYGLRMRTVNEKWENFREKTYDVVFAFNCFYRMSEIEECLAKMNRCGSQMHIIGMTSGPEQEYLRDYEKVLGLKINYHRMDYILLLNVLYQMGIDCNVRIVDLERDIRFASMESAVAKTSRRIISGTYEKEDLVRVLKRYLKKDADGVLHYIHHFKGALIYW